MERPLHSLPQHQNELFALAQQLLSAELTVEAHGGVLRAAFHPELPAATLIRFAVRTVKLCSTRPPPRLRSLVHELRRDGVVRRRLSRGRLTVPLIPIRPSMRRQPKMEGLPELTTVHELASWLGVDYAYLQWMADLQDRNALDEVTRLQHYTCQLRRGRNGTYRVLEAPKQLLKHMQRRILHDILDQIPVHPAVHGFRRGRSTVTFAQPHADRAILLRLDLREFFPSIPGVRVQALFRTLGYPEAVADLLGGLCTSTVPPCCWRSLSGDDDPQLDRTHLRAIYGRPHLPQGSPCSPAIANLCAYRMDCRLSVLAASCGATYTRYADDLAVSGDGRFRRQAERFVAQAAAIAMEQGFAVNHHKTRLMPQSGRQQLAGLTVNVAPGVPRREREQLEAILVNAFRRGPVSQNRAGRPDFRAFLAGKVAYVAMVHPRHGAKLRALYERIPWS